MQERTEMIAIRRTPAEVRARMDARRERRAPHPQDSSVPTADLPTSASRTESQGQAHRHQEQADAPRDRSRTPSKELRYIQHVLEQFSVEFGESFPSDWILTESCVFQLIEKNMTAEERALFVAAKRKELTSFFENNVWVHCSHVDPDRAMKARFLLKWRQTPEGEWEAKARLVLQGLKDPDALEGKLETSSPRAIRLARQALLSLAATHDMEVITADVRTDFLQGKPLDMELFVRPPCRYRRHA